MIAYLRGAVIARRDNVNMIVVDVGGVGYGVVVSAHTYGTLSSADDVELYIYTHVREQEISLYGFLAVEEQRLFEALLTISGVGPKAAMGILSVADVSTIVRAVGANDPALLTSVPGIGPKKAQRIVLELRSAVHDLVESLPDDDTVAQQAAADADVVDALVGMGYSAAEARDALRATTAEDVSARLKEALQYLGRQRS